MGYVPSHILGEVHHVHSPVYPGLTNTTKFIYFRMALESAPLTWLESLKPDSIDYLEDLKKTIINNF
jgi:hypothetical protein